MITIQIPGWFVWILFFIFIVNLVQAFALILVHCKNVKLQERILKQLKHMIFLKGKL